MAEKKQRKLVSIILNILTVVLLVVGLVLVFNKPIQKYLLHQKTNSYQVTKLDKKQVKANEKALTSGFYSPAPSQNPAQDLAARVKDTHKYIFLGEVHFVPVIQQEIENRHQEMRYER